MRHRGPRSNKFQLDQSYCFAFCSVLSSTLPRESRRRLSTSRVTSTMSTVGLALARPWHAYLTLLRAHPVRTKMATAAGMFVVGDSIAQLAIEDKELPLPGKKGDWDVRLTP